MPKTRDQRCHHVLKTYFENMPLTKNKYFQIEKKDERGWSSAHYEVVIPLQWTIPHYSCHVSDYENREYTQELEVEQLLSDEITIKFRNDFEKYEVKNTKKATSYLRLYQSSFEDNKIVFRIMVKYFKSEIPFPEDEHVIVKMHIDKPFDFIEVLQKENEKLRILLKKKKSDVYKKQQLIMNLEHRNRELMYKYRREKEYNLMNEIDSAEHSKNYRIIINGLYGELKKGFECPVCYESIPNSDTFTTHCNHVLCQGCAERCENKCPMCRTYMGYINSD